MFHRFSLFGIRTDVSSCCIQFFFTAYFFISACSIVYICCHYDWSISLMEGQFDVSRFVAFNSSVGGKNRSVIGIMPRILEMFLEVSGRRLAVSLSVSMLLDFIWKLQLEKITFLLWFPVHNLVLVGMAIYIGQKYYST